MIAPDILPDQADATGALVTKQLLSGMDLALDDRRRVDELVTQFEYSGVVMVPSESQQYQGQGAVKRFLTTLLVDNDVRSSLQRAVDSGAATDAGFSAMVSTLRDHLDISFRCVSPHLASPPCLTLCPVRPARVGAPCGGGRFWEVLRSKHTGQRAVVVQTRGV